jgi:hypothetical protein
MPSLESEDEDVGLAPTLALATALFGAAATADAPEAAAAAAAAAALVPGPQNTFRVVKKRLFRLVIVSRAVSGGVGCLLLLCLLEAPLPVLLSLLGCHAGIGIVMKRTGGTSNSVLKHLMLNSQGTICK